MMKQVSSDFFSFKITPFKKIQIFVILQIEFNNCSYIENNLKHAYLCRCCPSVTFKLQRFRGMFSVAHILQIAIVIPQIVFLLFLLCFRQ